MPLTENGYKERLIDKKIEQYLKIFGAISIEGPKLGQLKIIRIQQFF